MMAGLFMRPWYDAGMSKRTGGLILLIAGVVVALNVILSRFGTPPIPVVAALIVYLGIKAAFYGACALALLGLFLVIVSFLSAQK
jgi:hypothetical protein